VTRSEEIFIRYNQPRVRAAEVVLGVIAERMRETRQVVHQLSHPGAPATYHPPGDSCALCDGRERAEKLLTLYAADYAVVAGDLGEALATAYDEGSADE